MRITLAALLLICVIPSAAQQGGQADKPDKMRVPKKGDTISVKGCLRGSAVESADLLIEDGEGNARVQEQVPTLTYRLQGDKSLLKSLKEKHDRKVVEVKGVLKSELTRSGIGTDVGRTRIQIGVDPQNGRFPPGVDQALPVLEATSFQGTAVSCGK